MLALLLIAAFDDLCSKPSPVVSENGDVIFALVGDAKDVRLVGDFTPTSPTNYYWSEAGLTMEHVAAPCSLYIHRAHFESDARLDYAFIVDGRKTIDPKNPRTIFSGVAGGVTVSELVMPKHVLNNETERRDSVAHGATTVVDEPWASHKVRIYTPPGYDKSQKYPALYTADGGAWLEYLRLPDVLDNLIADRAIEPVIAVMIDPAAERSKWYSNNSDFIAYLARVVEHVDKRYPTSKRVHAGTSAGGRATVLAGLERPDLFPNLAVLSASLGPTPQLKEAKPGMNVWITAGTYEGAIVENAKLLEKHFAKTTVTITHEGHSFGAWRAHLPAMLRHFFAKRG